MLDHGAVHFGDADLEHDLKRSRRLEAVDTCVPGADIGLDEALGFGRVVGRGDGAGEQHEVVHRRRLDDRLGHRQVQHLIDRADIVADAHVGRIDDTAGLARSRRPWSRRSPCRTHKAASTSGPGRRRSSHWRRTRRSSAPTSRTSVPVSLLRLSVSDGRAAVALQQREQQRRSCRGAIARAAKAVPRRARRMMASSFILASSHRNDGDVIAARDPDDRTGRLAQRLDRQPPAPSAAERLSRVLSAAGTVRRWKRDTSPPVEKVVLVSIGRLAIASSICFSCAGLALAGILMSPRQPPAQAPPCCRRSSAATATASPGSARRRSSRRCAG